MLKTFNFGGVDFRRLPNPVEVMVKPESAKRLSNVPSHRVIHVLGRSVNENDKLVVFAKPGETTPIDRLYIGHIQDPPDKWV